MPATVRAAVRRETPDIFHEAGEASAERVFVSIELANRSDVSRQVGERHDVELTKP
jgi:hypothetical protein